jgi:asparagine synthase (glutamine-hydrolysing)
LSIIDLTTGHQPLSNERGSVWVVFNGEIYNYKQLRSELMKQGHAFATRTDTEVLVHLYEELGVSFLPKLNGMFAFALYDADRNCLLLGRDRVGIKPLYYAHLPDRILFGSELKSLLQDDSLPREIDRRVVDRFLKYDYVPGDRTLFRAIRKLPPGHVLVAEGGSARLLQYWDLSFSQPKHQGSFDDAAAELNNLLEQVVDDHMVSDVPVGCLLSGGVDSTAVLSVAARRRSARIKTFTIGFDGEGVADERAYARLAAREFGSDHYETTISAVDFRDFLAPYVWHLEEPVCEPPAVALYYVSRLAAQHVKVILSGEGGDEAFAGYSNYSNTLLLEALKAWAGPARRGLAVGFDLLGTLGGERLRKYGVWSRLPLADFYCSRTSGPHRYFHQSSASLYTSEFLAEVDSDWSLEATRSRFRKVADRAKLDQLLYVDTGTWLPDDLLLKADKITMANSIELRVPLLDHRVLEFAAALPTSWKVRGRDRKIILKHCLSRKVPRAILDRPKAGFPVPYERWLRYDLSDYVRDVVLDRRAVGRGLFRAEEIASLLEANTRRGLYSKEVFCLLVLELWFRTFTDT